MAKEDIKLPEQGTKALLQAWSDDNEMVLKSGKKPKPPKEPTKEEVRRYLEQM